MEVTRRAALAAAAGWWIGASAARSQDMVLLDPTQTVGQEHQDRIDRLARIARRLQIEPAPVVSTQVVPRDRQPPGFRVDVPVLRVVFSERSFFDTAGSRLRPEADAIVYAMAELLRGDPPDTAVFVAGHTDSRGSEAYNYGLSVERADAVAKALFAEGVGEVALWRVGFGEAAPLYPNDSDPHMAFNRRVEFLFAARTEPVLDVLKRQLDHVCAAPDAAAAERCKQTVEVRKSFEAVQLSNRRMSVDLPAAHASAQVAKGASSASAGKHAAVAAVSRVQRTAQVAVRRVSIDLRKRQVSVDLPPL